MKTAISDKMFFGILTVFFCFVIVYVIFLVSTGFSFSLVEGIVTKKIYMPATISDRVANGTKLDMYNPEKFVIYFTSDESWNQATIPKELFLEIKLGDTFNSNCVCIVKQ